MSHTAFKIILTMATGLERNRLRDELIEQEYRVQICDSGDDLWKYMNANPDPHVLLLDTNVSGSDAEELLEAIMEHKLGVCVILVTDEHTANMAAVWSSLGAWGFLVPPINWGLLTLYFERIAQFFELRRENAKLQSCLGAGSAAPTCETFAGPGILKALADARHAIRGAAPVLIQGEYGADKAALANEIHKSLQDGAGSFVTLNCLHTATAGDTAFASAASGAKGGTLFIDEISALPRPDQDSLLRMLREQEDMQPAEEHKSPGNNRFRLIAGTSVNLALEVGRGEFNGDLFNMLAHRAVRLPPLRERTEDIPELAARFLAAAGPDPLRPKTISRKAVDILCNYYWPGNEQELRNVLERAAVHSATPALEAEDILAMLSPAGHSAVTAGASPDKDPAIFFPSFTVPLQDIEREYITRVLEHFNYHREHSAQSLGISRKTLYLKMKEYDLNRIGNTGARISQSKTTPA